MASFLDGATATLDVAIYDLRLDAGDGDVAGGVMGDDARADGNGEAELAVADAAATPSDPLAAPRASTYLILTSSQYQVER